MDPASERAFHIPSKLLEILHAETVNVTYPDVNYLMIQNDPLFFGQLKDVFISRKGKMRGFFERKFLFKTKSVISQRKKKNQEKRNGEWKQICSQSKMSQKISKLLIQLYQLSPVKGNELSPLHSAIEGTQSR